MTAYRMRGLLMGAVEFGTGKKAKLDGLSDLDVKVLTLKKLKPELKVDGKSEAYIDARLDAAVALFDEGVGHRLRISGVNPQTTKAELKKLAHGGARFDCCADLGYAAEDTYGNAREAGAWARFHHYRTLLIVTARYHMPRGLSEFQAAMPDMIFVPYPVDPVSIHPNGWWHNLHALRVLHWEYAKYLAATALTAIGRKPSGLDRSARHGESPDAS